MIKTLFKKGRFLLIKLSVIFFLTGGSVKHTSTSFFLFIQKPFIASMEYIMHITSDVSTYIQSKNKLKEENKALMKEIERNRAEMILEEDFKRDYQALLEIAHIAPKESIIARVIPAPRSHSFGTITINKGVEEGITIGMKVVLYDTILVGFVEELFTHNSRIRLLSSFNTKTQLKLGESGSTVLAIGRGGSMLVITVPRGFPIAVGERLLFIDTAPLLAGFIDTVKKPGAEAIQEIQAIIPFDPTTISFVVLSP